MTSCALSCRRDPAAARRSRPNLALAATRPASRHHHRYAESHDAHRRLPLSCAATLRVVCREGGRRARLLRGRFADEEGTLGNVHFASLFTEQFGLDRSFFVGKRILDVGCGPRGSLEWADDAARRVGIDPLVEGYRELGIDQHAMEYVGTPVEHLPFPDSSFDVVSSLNSLDHVDDLDAAVAEITRVLAPGGSFLLEVEFGHRPTPAEPIEIPADFAESLVPAFALASCERFALSDHQVHRAHAEKVPYRASGRRRPGVLVARLVKEPFDRPVAAP